MRLLAHRARSASGTTGAVRRAPYALFESTFEIIVQNADYTMVADASGPFRKHPKGSPEAWTSRMMKMTATQWTWAASTCLQTGADVSRENAPSIPSTSRMPCPVNTGYIRYSCYGRRSRFFEPTFPRRGMFSYAAGRRK